MAKILLFADIHCWPHKRSNNRLQDCLRALDWVFQTAVDHKIENVLFLGDLFHNRQKIDVLTYQCCVEVFEKFLVRPQGPAFNIYLLLGNHDMWHMEKWDISSVFPLRNIPGVTVIDKPCTLEIAGQPISFLPYTANPTEDLKSIKNTADFKILCSHLAVSDAVFNVYAQTYSDISIETDEDMVKVDASIFGGWDQVFLGHYHAKQALSPTVEYIGSPLQLSFGEAFTHKEVLIYDSQTHKKQYVRNKFSPQHFIIPANDVEKYEMDNNFIRLLVDDMGRADVVELRKSILENHQVGSLEIRPAEVKHEHEKIAGEIEDAKSILFKESEMLEKYISVKEDSLSGLQKAKLLEIGKNIIGQ